MEMDAAVGELCACEYPVEFETVVDRCGDTVVEFSNGESMPLSEVVSVVDDYPTAFQTEAELHDFVVSILPEASVGRKRYDDPSGRLDPIGRHGLVLNASGRPRTPSSDLSRVPS
jgi:hypothetical protein